MESVRTEAGSLLSAVATAKCWKDFRGKERMEGRKRKTEKMQMSGPEVS